MTAKWPQIAMTRARERLVLCGRIASNRKEETLKGWWAQIRAGFDHADIAPHLRQEACGAVIATRYGPDPRRMPGAAGEAAPPVAAPAWAQAPMTPGAAKPPAAAPAPAAAAPAAAAPKMATQRHHRPMRHMAAHHGKMRVRGGAGDQMTEQLNREELARIQGGGMPGPMGPGPANAGAGQGGPRASGR